MKGAIEASGVSFTYEGGTRALNEVDFRANPGELVAMLASNGSGKTTLIKVLVGLLKPQAGRVRIDGTDMAHLAPVERYRRVGVVLQNPTDQLFAATVEEDVAFGPRNLELPEPEVERRVTEALESVDVGGLRKRAIHHLSFGEQKRVAVAGVLAMGPRILLLDEPTAGLDPQGETQMMRLLRRLNRERGITIVVATHSVDLLPLFADRLCVLSRGQVLQQGPVEEVFSNLELLDRANLRLPYVAALAHELKRCDGVPLDGLPLTVGDARKQIVALIPEELLVKGLAGGKP
ncbi:MAG: energy-coupling factor ABC transporter ATP-binding protein [Myxococcaceae bacterium]